MSKMRITVTAMAMARSESLLICSALVTAMSGPPIAVTFTPLLSCITVCITLSSFFPSSAFLPDSLAPVLLEKYTRPCLPSAVKM